MWTVAWEMFWPTGFISLGSMLKAHLFHLPRRLWLLYFLKSQLCYQASAPSTADTVIDLFGYCAVVLYCTPDWAFLCMSCFPLTNPHLTQSSLHMWNEPGWIKPTNTTTPYFLHCYNENIHTKKYSCWSRGHIKGPCKMLHCPHPNDTHFPKAFLDWITWSVHFLKMNPILWNIWKIVLVFAKCFSVVLG